MSTLSVTVEKLKVFEHPDADALELAQVGLFRAVVPKGVYKNGEYGLYIPEGAIVPQELLVELGLLGRLAGKQKNRVKAIRLRGELSQGIVCRPENIGVNAWTQEYMDLECPLHGDACNPLTYDFASDLGITKWVPEIPTHMDGVVESAPDLIRWIEIENIKRYPEVFESGEPVVVTEKLHGTCLAATIVRHDPDVEDGPYDLHVTSKGYGSKNLAIVDDPKNLYWRALRADDCALLVALEAVSGWLKIKRLAIFGEVYGQGVQDLHYGANARSEDTIGFRVFDLAIDYGDGQAHFLDVYAVDQLFKLLALRVKRVPELFRGPFDMYRVQKLATGMEAVTGTQAHMREGVVIRSQIERHDQRLGGRAILKAVSDDYLLRTGGTEFE